MIFLAYRNNQARYLVHTIFYLLWNMPPCKKLYVHQEKKPLLPLHFWMTGRDNSNCVRNTMYLDKLEKLNFKSIPLFLLHPLHYKYIEAVHCSSWEKVSKHFFLTKENIIFISTISLYVFRQICLHPKSSLSGIDFRK